MRIQYHIGLMSLMEILCSFGVFSGLFLEEVFWVSRAACQGVRGLFVPLSSVGTVGQEVHLSSVGTCGPVVPLSSVGTSGHVSSLVECEKCEGSYLQRHLCVILRRLLYYQFTSDVSVTYPECIWPLLTLRSRCLRCGDVRSHLSTDVSQPCWSPWFFPGGGSGSWWSDSRTDQLHCADKTQNWLSMDSELHVVVHVM